MSRLPTARSAATNGGFDLSYGRQKWGNFISASGLNTGRFLDGPEFQVFHDHGNEENVFDRVDFKLSDKDTINLNLGFTRSWFQTPNSYDAQNATAWNGLVVNNGGLGPDGLPVGSADQRSKIRTFNIAPVWTRLINPNTVFTFGGFVRQDQYNYYPSANPFADLHARSPVQRRVGQNRRLTNAGRPRQLVLCKGIHNIKIGAQYEHTFLTERDTFGLVDPTVNAPCLNADGSPDTDPTLTNPNGCPGGAGQSESRTFIPLLACYDLTRTAPLPASDGCPNSTSGEYSYYGHADIREFAFLHSGRDHCPQLDLQSRPARRQIQRHHQRRAGGTAPRHRLQHQADQHGAAGLLCPHHGNPVQRKPGAGEPGMQRSGDRRVPELGRGRPLRVTTCR